LNNTKSAQQPADESSGIDHGSSYQGNLSSERATRRNRLLSPYAPILVAVFGLAISLAAFFFTKSWENERLRFNFERLAELRCLLFQDEIEQHVHELKALERFYNGSQFVDNNEFGEFITPILTAHSDLLAFAWAPRVSNADRASFEKNARSQGFTDYSIYDHSAAGNKSTAIGNDEYYPILYYRPSVEWALGWDLLSEPVQREAIERAIQSGQPSATAPLTLTGDTTDQSCVIVFHPVFDQSRASETKNDRVKSIKGMVLAIFRPGKALEVIDLSSVQSEHIVYRHWSRLQDQDTLDEQVDTYDSNGLAFTTSIDFAGRSWELRCRPSSSYAASNTLWIPWALLVGGLMLTIMLTAQLHAQQNRTAIVEKLVHERTARLEMARKAQAALLRISETAADIDSLELLLEVVCQQLGTVIATTNFYVALYDRDSRVYSFPYWKDEYDGADFSPQQLEKSLTDYVRRTGKPLFANDEVHQSLEEEGEVTLVGTASAIWLGVPLRVSSVISGVMVVQDYSDPHRYSRADLELMSSVSQSIAQVIERQFAADQRQDLQGKLERAQRMESLGVLAGGVAHDLNNLIGPLVGYPELILRKLPEESPIRRQVQKIQKSAKQAAEVIQDLLTLARRGRYEMSPLNLNEIIDSYLESPGFQELMNSNPNIQLHSNLGKSLVNIRGSASHLYKTMMNLIMNAVEAMPDGGELRIETNQEYITSLAGGHQNVEAGDYVMIRVSDTGTGIDSDDLGRVFEPYYSKKKMGASGSGLGLSVVYGIVKDHKGYYDVFSEKGLGTTFILYFPASGEMTDVTSTQVNVSGGSESVLVVDDSEEQRDLAFDVLSSFGYQVSVVSSGREAVNFIQRSSADILVLDMIMEDGFDGLDTYREIVKLRPDQKAIVVSGFSQTDRVNEMQRLGAGRYVRKPYTADELGISIRAELDEVRSVPRTKSSSLAPELST